MPNITLETPVSDLLSFLLALNLRLSSVQTARIFRRTVFVGIDRADGFTWLMIDRYRHEISHAPFGYYCGWVSQCCVVSTGIRAGLLLRAHQLGTST